MEKGLAFVFVMVFTQTIVAFLNPHLALLQIRMGASASHAMISLVYHKIFRLSAAVNKKYKKGDIVNFISVDARTMVWLTEQLPVLAKFPI